ncbi:Uncharacterized protein LOK49_LG15G01837 [Camellia lanceoleosa]|uniref:Uncharacterized protein n=1 Tax=Camellia lanceoleosa TaxID=1840588 RepID=A0ACC0F7Y3_9ERIC|nr:Uncharacterized protein LOK49_LG15G01837 [Camellia lanceoleosa]
MMVEEVKQDPSLTRKNSFTTRHWSQVDDKLYKHFKVRYTVSHLKQKYPRIRQSYNTFVKLKNHMGFGWDDQRKRVTASDDVWDQYGKGPSTFDEEMDIQSAFFGVGINSNIDSFHVGDEIEGDDEPKVGGRNGNDGGRKGAHLDLALDT